MSIYSYTRLQKYSNISRTLSSWLLSRSRFCFSLSPCIKKVVQQVLSTSLLFSSECFGKGFYCILPWHASLLWSEFSCALLSGCVAQLNGSSYRTPGKQNTFYPCPHPQREKEALQVPADFGSMGWTAWLCCLGKVMKSYSWCRPIKMKHL